MKAGTQTPLKVVLAEDNPLVRLSMVIYLERCGHYTIVGEAANGQEVLELALNKKPDVILMDINMPGMGGIEATKAIKDKLPEVKIVMLTCETDLEQVDACLNSGAAAYCLKDIEMDKLTEVIEDVLDETTTPTNTQPWVDPAIFMLRKNSLKRKGLSNKSLYPGWVSTG